MEMKGGKGRRFAGVVGLFVDGLIFRVCEGRLLRRKYRFRSGKACDDDAT